MFAIMVVNSKAPSLTVSIMERYNCKRMGALIMSVILMLSALSEQEALEIIANAYEQAYEKAELSYALALPEALSEDGQREISAFGKIKFVESDQDPFTCLPPFCNEADYALMASEGMVFKKFWDLRLIKAFERLNKQKAALTGFLPDIQDRHGAVCPVAVDKVEEGMVHFHKGAPLYRAVMPQKCAFINPWFSFGKPAFFECMALESETPAFLRPFESGYTLYTLNDPCIQTFFEQRIEPMALSLMEPDEFNESVVSRFYDTYRLPDSPSAVLGLYTADLQYDMEITLIDKMRESFRQFRLRNAPGSPLFVSAYYDMPCKVPSDPIIYESRFRNLARLKNLPLALFSRGSMTGNVKRYFHNVYDYQRAYGLPPDMTVGTEFERFKAGKFKLLHHCTALFPHHSHYAWIDFGYQRFPVYGGLAIDFLKIIGSTVHIARVGGKLDTTCFTVPRELVSHMDDAMLSVVRGFIEEGKALDENELFEELLMRESDLFTVHDLPEKRSLFHEAMNLRKDRII